MANSLGWADTNVAATYSLTLLFLRTPLLSAVGALPTLLTAQVAFNKLNKFALAPFKAEFPRPQAFPNWQTLELRNVTFAYQDNAFSVGPINLTIKRGELLFLIGGNGSGKIDAGDVVDGLVSATKRRNLAGWQTCQWRTTGRLSQTVFGSVYRCLAV